LSPRPQGAAQSSVEGLTHRAIAVSVAASGPLARRRQCLSPPSPKASAGGPESGRSDSARRVRSLWSSKLQVTTGGPRAPDDRPSSHHLRDAGATEHQRRPLSRRAV